MSSSSGTLAFLGIDLGTSQLKVLLTSPDAPDVGGVGGVTVLGRGRAPYPVTVPAAGRAETDPEQWWRAAATAVRQAQTEAEQAGARPDVAGLAVAGQMHGVVLADSAGTPLRPAILWLDRRAAAEAAAYSELPAELTGPLGNQPSPGMAGPILRWLTRHEPAAISGARWALQPKDWLRLRLTGEAATDPTDASGTLLFDLTRGSWAADVIKALGLPGAKLPEIREPALIAGRLGNAAAELLGLDPGIPVATGAADTAAALYAADPPADAALLTLGSGGQWIVPTAACRPAAGTNVFRAVQGGCYRLAPAQNVGITLDWVRELLRVSWQELYDTAARPWRADTPVFLPYLTQERWDATAAGTWAGLTLAHHKDDLLRAALEGIAFLLRARLEDVRAAGHDPGNVIIGGGGTRHPAWRQLLADVLGLPLYPAGTSWLSATGAAMLAAAATGVTAGLPGGASRDRSGSEKEAIAPGERDAASTAYGRFLSLRRTTGGQYSGNESL